MPSAPMRQVLLLGLLLGACVPPPGQVGTHARGSFRFDTESVARARYAGLTGTHVTTTTSAMTTVASGLGRLAPALLGVLNDQGKADELGERLTECARLADQQINRAHFGDRAPTRQDCGEEVSADGCDEPITRAMLLGRLKHELALACAREVLSRLWPAPFSIEQRYRYYPNVPFVETVSSAEEQRLIELGCTQQLWRTIKPDIVLHANRDLLRAVLVLDFKFPCPGTNPPSWKHYGATSAYANTTQGEVYQRALGGRALLVTPQKVWP